MCGIWASFHAPGAAAAFPILSEIFSEPLQSRGPDKTLVVEHPQCWLAFFRLAFHDLSPRGDQPMVFFEGVYTYYLLANGEIYNYRELVQTFSLPMQSKNDCEVIYRLYDFFEGNFSRVLQHLDGEYAIVLVKLRGDTLLDVVAARDPYGVRPLFYGLDLDQQKVYLSSLARGIPYQETHPFPPGTWMHVDAQFHTEWNAYHDYPDDFFRTADTSRLCSLLIQAVDKRRTGERPMACLLSGGLDSSLVCAIMVKILGVQDLHTFSIGMEGSTDLVYAAEVARFLGTHHDVVHFTAQEGVDAVDYVIEACETWDITTIRASVGQYLLAKHISETTDFKAIMNGDGADEVAMGYLYWYQAPTRLDAHLESVHRLQEIHLYDGLRVDRCLGRFGLEARVPYLDRAWVDFMLRTPIASRMPSTQRMEKHLIREAFATHYPGLLPDSVLWRKKEAFSDGVSSPQQSWFRILQTEMEKRVGDKDMETNPLGFPEVPPSKEAWYYQKKFKEIFGHKPLIPAYWLPRWSGEIREPSARVLSVYSSSTTTPSSSLPVSVSPSIPYRESSSDPSKT